MSVQAKSEGFQSPHGVRRTIFLSRFDIKCFESLCQPFLFLGFSQFFLFHVISKQLLCHLRRPFCVFWVLVFNDFFDVLLGQRSKSRSHVFASSPTASNTKRANLTWLPLEIMYRGHTWHDYPWPWHDYCIICSYDVTGADFENSLPIRKEIVSSMCSKTINARRLLQCYLFFSFIRPFFWSERARNSFS